MKDYIYRTKGVCSSTIKYKIENNKISDILFVGGCSGNAQGISRLAEGMNVDDLIQRLEGVKCGFKGTSCPDQLARALKENKGE